MSLADIILERFKDFMREQPEPYKFLQVFYAQEKERFLNDRMNDYIKQNKSKEEASILDFGQTRLCERHRKGVRKNHRTFIKRFLY
ncbi:hypothetical protein VN0759_03940 [Helicobacter pylori]|nr:hypothetical protein VN0759_03940 [Helicobacter pylori]